jgi:hypothetical protein
LDAELDSLHFKIIGIKGLVSYVYILRVDSFTSCILNPDGSEASSWVCDQKQLWSDNQCCDYIDWCYSKVGYLDGARMVFEFAGDRSKVVWPQSYQRLQLM